MSNRGHWKVHGRQLVVELESAAVVVPSAEDIFIRVFKGHPADPWPELDLNENLDLKGLSFSRYPAELQLVITRPAEGLTSLSMAFVARADGEEFQVAAGDLRTSSHLVLGNRWYPLDPEELSEIRGIVNDLSLADAERLSLRSYLALRRLAGTSGLIRDLPTALDVEGTETGGLAQVESVPSSIPLYPYQADGFRWLRLLYDEQLGGILADEMGLGKTIQIIALLSSAKRPESRPSLVVGTTSILENWRRELNRFGPSLNVLLHRGSIRTGFPSRLRQADVVVTSYDTMLRDASLLSQVDWDVVVLDEAHAIKNPRAARTQAAKKLRRRVSIAVTGTPVQNRLLDLWSLMDFAVPGYLGDLQKFESDFADDVDEAAEIGRLTAPLMLRRLVADVARDLPPRIDIPQVLQLHSSNVEAYEQLRGALNSKGTGTMTFQNLVKLRMLCAHPVLAGIIGTDLTETSTKYARLIELLYEIRENGDKALIFASFTKMIDLIVEDLPRRLGIPTMAIDGRTDPEDRQEMVDRFGKIDGPAVLVLNPQAAGVGLNITAANHVIHYTLEWNPAVEDQASARAYRRGQTLPVTVHRLFYADTIEELMDQRLARKRSIAGSAVVGTDGRDDEYEDVLAALRMSPTDSGGD